MKIDRILERLEMAGNLQEQTISDLLTALSSFISSCLTQTSTLKRYLTLLLQSWLFHTSLRLLIVLARTPNQNLDALVGSLRLAFQANDSLYPKILQNHERKHELCSHLASLVNNPKSSFNALCILGTLASSDTF